jgi:predicted PurR-regulated permease PerM
VVSLIFWAWMLGPMGALMAVPMTTAVQRLILEADDGTRWLSELLSAGEAGDEKPEAQG